MAVEFRIVVVADPNPAKRGLGAVDQSLAGTEATAGKLAAAMQRAVALNVTRFLAEKAVVQRGLSDLQATAKKTGDGLSALIAGQQRQMGVKDLLGKEKGWASTFGAGVLTPQKHSKEEIESLISGYNATAVAAAKARQGIVEAGDAAATSAGKMGMLGKAVKAGAMLLVAKEVGGLADQFTNFQNRLRAITTDEANVAQLTDTLYGVAQRTRSEWQAVTEVFVRTSGALKGLGYSQGEVIDFTETLTKTVKMSGASSIEANNAMIQLSQGLASGTLRGDELRSVLEQLPTVADVISKSLGVTRGQLRQMGMEGKITTTQIIKAFQESKKEIDANFGRTVPTIAEQFVMLKNTVVRAIGELMPVLGPVIDALATIIKLLGDVIGVAAKAMGALGEAVGDMAHDLGVALDVVHEVPPTMAEATAFAEEYKNEIASGAKIVALIADEMMEQAKAQEVVNQAVDSFLALAPEEQAKNWAADLSVTAHALKKVNAEILIMAEVTAQWREEQDAARVATEAGTKALEKSIGLAWVGMIQAATLKSAEEANRIIKLKETITALAEEADPAAKKLAHLRDAQAYFNEAVKEGIITQELADKLQGNLEKGHRLDKAKEFLADLKNLKSAFLSAHEAANPMIAANNELARTQELVNKAVAAFPQLEEAGIKIMEHKREVLAAQLDPLGATLDALRDEVQLLRLSNDEREREVAIRAELAKLPTDLRTDESRGLIAREIDNARALRQSAELADEAASRRRDMLESIRGPQMQYQADLATLNALLQEGDISQEQYNRRLEELQAAMGTIELPTDSVRSFDRGVLDGLDAIKANILDTASLVESAMTKAFSGAEDAVVAFVTGAEFDFKAMVNNILQDLTRLLFRLLLIRAIKLGIGGDIGAGGGGALGALLDKVGGFATGGSFKVPGAGGTDSQLVMFRATPGERVDVSTQAQQRSGTPGGTAFGGGGVAPVINVPPPQVIIVDRREDALEAFDTPGGQRKFVDFVRRNRDAINTVLK